MAEADFVAVVRLEPDSAGDDFGLLLKPKIPINIPMAMRTNAPLTSPIACLLFMLFIRLVVDRADLIGLDSCCFIFDCEILYLSIIVIILA